MDHDPFKEKIQRFKRSLAEVFKLLTPNHYILSELEAAGISLLNAGSSIESAIIDPLVEEGVLHLKIGTLEVVDRGCLWTLINEILREQVYYFQSSSPAPFIIDAGAHIGISTLFFKSCYPQARILGFEPCPGNFALCERNVARNALSNVRIVPYALSDRNGRAEFYAQPDYSMAGSIAERFERDGPRKIDVVSVETSRLGDWVDGEVDLLKLDIEGVEDLVLCDLGDTLRQVRNVVCEYHDGRSLPRVRLVKILSTLTEHGFNFRIHPSFSRKDDRFQPLCTVEQSRSMMIFATRKP